MQQRPHAQGCGEERFDLSTTHQTSLSLLSFPFTSASCCALGNWELGLLPTSKSYQSPQNKRLSPCRSRWHRCPELHPAPWPCREGSSTGSKLSRVLHGAGGPALLMARSRVAEDILAGPCLTFAMHHEMQPPLRSPQGSVAGCCVGCFQLQGGPKPAYLEVAALHWQAVGHSLRPGAQRAGEGGKASTGHTEGARHEAKCPLGLAGWWNTCPGSASVAPAASLPGGHHSSAVLCPTGIRDCPT